MPKKPHPADIADREKIETAIGFNVHLRTSPTEKLNQPAATLRAAIKAADAMGRAGTKSPMIYAISAEKHTVLVPQDMIDAERAAMAQDAADDESMKQPLSGSQIAQLSAIITGGGMKRSNSKAVAEARFVKLAAEHGITAERIADLLEGPFAFAEQILREHATGRPMTIPQVEAARDLIAAGTISDPAHRKVTPNAIKWDARDGAAPANIEDIPAPALPKRRKIAAKLQDAPTETKKREKAAAKPKAEAPAGGKRAAALEAAQRGILPEAPDFSAATHARFRTKLEGLVAMAKAGDIAGLKAATINPVSSSPKAMDKYRNLAVIALEATEYTVKA